jgi:hypothetical protein
LIREFCDLPRQCLVTAGGKTRENNLIVYEQDHQRLLDLGIWDFFVFWYLEFEIFLSNENWKLYEDRATNRKLFNQIIPVIRFLENLLRSKGIPYLLDYTPSGGHILFQNLLGYRAAEELKKIGSQNTL